MTAVGFFIFVVAKVFRTTTNDLVESTTLCHARRKLADSPTGMRRLEGKKSKSGMACMGSYHCNRLCRR